MAEEPKVSIIVLTFNSISKLGSFFDEVIASLSNVQYSNAEIVFVDNGSTDNTVDYLRACIVESNMTSKARVVELTRNYGWAGGNNRGALMCKNSDYFLFLNDDVIVEPNTIGELIKQLEADRLIGAAQPTIVNRDGTVFCGFDIGVAGFARPRILKESPKGVAVDIFYAMGSALVTRSELFFRLGMFDEDYFYWYDDVDYCWRVRLAGFKVVCVMDASVHHYGSATFGKDNPILNYYWIRNNLCMCSKNYRYRELILTTPIRIGEIIIGGLGHNLSSRNTSGLKLSIKGLIDGIKDSPLFLRKRAVLKGLRARNSVAELLDPHIDIELLLGWVLPRFNNWIPRY